MKNEILKELSDSVQAFFNNNPDWNRGNAKIYIDEMLALIEAQAKALEKYRVICNDSPEHTQMIELLKQFKQEITWHPVNELTQEMLSFLYDQQYKQESIINFQIIGKDQSGTVRDCCTVYDRQDDGTKIFFIEDNSKYYELEITHFAFVQLEKKEIK